MPCALSKYIQSVHPNECWEKLKILLYLPSAINQTLIVIVVLFSLVIVNELFVLP
jgi:hypothetical protein